MTLRPSPALTASLVAAGVATGVVTGAAGLLVLAAPASAAGPSPEPSRVPLQSLVSAGARPATPTLQASPVPTVVPSPRRTDAGGGDIEVPAGKADVSVTTSGGGTGDLLLVALAGGGALLLAGGAVVTVSRRRS